MPQVPQVSYPVLCFWVLNIRMHKNTPKNQPNPNALIPLLVRVKTAPTVQHQFDLLCGAGEFRSFKIIHIPEREKLSICECCGAMTTPWGPYGDLLELEFFIHGFQLIFKSRELWEGGRASLRILKKNPLGYRANLERQLDRLQIKSLPKPIEALFSGVDVQSLNPSETSSAKQPEDSGAAAQIAADAQAVQWLPITVTGYWRASDRAPLDLKFPGLKLNQPVEGLQPCTADLNFYPLGSILCIKTNEVEEFRIVTQSGNGIGAHHLALPFDSLAQAEARGTHKAELIVVRQGWN